MNRIKWVKVDTDESYYQSADGRFELNPLYCGRVRPQGWEVVDNITKQKHRCYFSLKDAKKIAQRWLDNSGK